MFQLDDSLKNLKKRRETVNVQVFYKLSHFYKSSTIILNKIESIVHIMNICTGQLLIR